MSVSVQPFLGGETTALPIRFDAENGAESWFVISLSVIAIIGVADIFQAKCKIQIFGCFASCIDHGNYVTWCSIGGETLVVALVG